MQGACSHHSKSGKALIADRKIHNLKYFLIYTFYNDKYQRPAVLKMLGGSESGLMQYFSRGKCVCTDVQILTQRKSILCHRHQSSSPTCPHHTHHPPDVLLWCLVTRTQPLPASKESAFHHRPEDTVLDQLLKHPGRLS